MTAGGSAGKDFVGGVFKQGLKVPVPAWTTPTQTNVCAGPVCRNDRGRGRNRGCESLFALPGSRGQATG